MSDPPKLREVMRQVEREFEGREVFTAAEFGEAVARRVVYYACALLATYDTDRFQAAADVLEKHFEVDT